MPISDIPMTKERINFIKRYSDLTEDEKFTELLYAQQMKINKLERIRRNTSLLVWWLIALPILFVLFFFVLGFGALAGI
ncbi:hypothetical protein SAMN03097699_0767 [Flavobacteriaceae bacterium MAR_2010_188]|nr:hypothetical protein SAMN03097699_0767 [Flavobacteriaceae bacterium MAR_2010_188]